MNSMIEITNRWGLAKRGIFDFKGEEIEIPNIFFLEGKHFTPPDYAELSISAGDEGFLKIPSSFFENEESDLPNTFAYPEGIDGEPIQKDKGLPSIQIIYDQEPDPDAEVYVIGNAPQLLKRSERLYDKIVSLRKKIEFHKLIYVPGIAQPNNLAVLTYLGVDLFDSSFIELMGFEGAELSNLFNFDGDPKKNHHHLLEELKLVRKTITHGKIRDLVESRVRSEPWLVELLRKADEDYRLFSKGVPIIGDDVFVTTREGLHRPDIERFRRRIRGRYDPPDRDILLLLPCSAKKPYFQSRSHRRFREATSNVCWTDIHEVILTSPLGLVPRELELFYPAQQYDIPVTHEWFQEEMDMIINQLKSLLDKGTYKKIISHLPPDMEFVNEEIECIDTTHGQHPTSSKAINELNDTLKEILGIKNKKIQRYLNENIASFCRFQFGEGGEDLLDGANIKGKYPWYKIISDETQRGMLVPERGLISLTLEGAEIIKEKEINQVMIDDFRPKGSIFAVGIKDADKTIIPGEETVVIHEDELRGVGPAVMSGDEMVEAERGEAIKLRHYP